MKCCENLECKHFGKPLVNLGYGYPVCQGQPACLYPKPMMPQYTQYKKYKKMYKVIKMEVDK